MGETARSGDRRVGPPERRQSQRRHIDFYAELGKFAGLVAAVTAAVIGQAELIGEPWRHFLTVTAIGAAAAAAYCMKAGAIGHIFKGGKS